MASAAAWTSGSAARRATAPWTAAVRSEMAVARSVICSSRSCICQRVIMILRENMLLRLNLDTEPVNLPAVPDPHLERLPRLDAVVSFRPKRAVEIGERLGHPERDMGRVGMSLPGAEVGHDHLEL